MLFELEEFMPIWKDIARALKNISKLNILIEVEIAFLFEFEDVF